MRSTRTRVPQICKKHHRNRLLKTFKTPLFFNGFDNRNQSKKTDLFVFLIRTIRKKVGFYYKNLLIYSGLYDIMKKLMLYYYITFKLK